MKYKSQLEFTHKQPDKIGVLITNLGTPKAPTKQALKPYLKEFLSDPRVVEFPRFLWWFILNGIILNIRPKRSAAAYQTVWTEQGSPLLLHTKNQCEGIEARIKAEYGDTVIIDYAMRYGEPSIHSAIDNLLNKGARKLFVLPLYPQYCASTTGSTFDALASDFKKRRWLPELRFLNHYCDNEAYIDCLATKIENHWEKHGRAERLVLSYHGIPKRYLMNGDPYHCQCHKTSRLVARKLGLTEHDYVTTFQSRFGREEWLKPYTDETLKSLPKQGVSSIQVCCPGFSSDCLETIEEIGEENKEYFLENGGERFEYIEALNSDPQHLDMLSDLVINNIKDWKMDNDIELREALANVMGAEK